jgi:cullin-4
MSLAARPQLPSDFEATAWAKLKEAVNAIHAKRPVSYSFEELYRVSTSLHRAQSGQARLCTVTLQPCKQSCLAQLTTSRQNMP